MEAVLAILSRCIVSSRNAMVFQTLPARPPLPAHARMESNPPASCSDPPPKLLPSAPSIPRNHARRKRKREDDADRCESETRDKVLDKFVRDASTTIPGAYSAKNEIKDHAQAEYPRDELLQQRGFNLIEWDGLTYFPIVDSEGRIIAVLVDQLRDKRYRQSALAVFNLPADEFASFGDDDVSHRRGNFPALNVGVAQFTSTTTGTRKWRSVCSQTPTSNVSQRLQALPRAMKEVDLKAQDPGVNAEMCQVRGDRWEMGIGFMILKSEDSEEKVPAETAPNSFTQPHRI
ncbi:hypothetical protein HYPSUDRAFT_209441 [Hypholoma sublateritium FD-334 SS-4]|uniref:Uncharacterized protein n=1 Tax=Hypholoma sublateritium (strain FD-334 SS-4) TaxID=945553 RepID=A0A0D2LRT0_HYPSF|nr:hypothetical protein HYPSUDRAFT_209441 [Hypholoma sublateritium FD-334 SS-4]